MAQSQHPQPRSDPYLDGLIVKLAELDRPFNSEHLDQLVSQAERDGTALDTSEETREVLREAKSAAGHVRGRYISLMRDSALSFLKDHHCYDELTRIPVAMLPTGLLNGQALLNPQKEPLILIDSGMTRELTEIVHAFRGFFTWGFGEQAHCRDHPQIAFAQTLALLTAVVLSGDSNLRELCPARLDACPSIRPNSDRREMLVRYANRIRDFVLLHEYGHVALGHLLKAESRSFRIGPATVIAQVARHAEEYEADAFAVSALARMRDEMSLRYSADHVVAALAEPIGVLFRFWDLVDASVRKQGGQLPGTHPPAIRRWQKIRAGLTHSGVKKDFLSDVDDAFDTILQWYQLAPTSDRS